MHFLAAVYILVLTAILAAGVKPAQLGWLRTAVAVFLLAWAVLILTAQSLSPFSALNVTWLFIGISIVIALFGSVGLRKLFPARELSFPTFESPFSPRAAAIVMALLAVSFALVLAGQLVLAWGFLPSNPDSIVYRFPRVYWYFGEGSLAHFSNQGEPRPQFYPLNGVIAYLPLLHFQLGPRSFSLMSLACWLMTGLATYVFARDLGGRRVVAAATAWLIVLTPNVLIQALSTNDELIAAAPMLAGLFFLHRWFRARQPFDVLIGVIGVTISAGTKLHVSYYVLLIALIAIVLACHARAFWAEVRGWLSVRGIGFIALLASIILVFAFSFLIYNYRATGLLMPWDFVAQVQNKPFNVFAALQNVVLQTAHVVLTPIADLYWGDALDAKPLSLHYDAFNAWFAPLFTWVDNGAAFMSAGYRFTGINRPNSILFGEQTVYIGFVWLVWLIAVFWLISRWRDPQFLWAGFHAASFPVWIVTYAAMSRYIEGFAVYLGYATIVMAPVMVFAFAPIERPRLAQLRLAVLAAVAATHAFFAADIIYTSPAKNLVSLYYALTQPSSRGFTIDQSVTDEVGMAKSGVYHHSIAWGQPFWAFMAYRPDIRHFLASSGDLLMPRADLPVLHVYSFPQFPAYGHAVPIRIPDKVSTGLTWIGDLLFALGPEWVFAVGNDVETRFPGRDKYMVVRFEELSNFGRSAEPAIRISPTIYGLGGNDGLKFRFDVKIDGKIVSSSDWQAVPNAELATPGLRPGSGVLTVYVRNDSADGSVHSASVALQSTKAVDLTQSTR
jgi:hypothetical protein